MLLNLPSPLPPSYFFGLIASAVPWRKAWILTTSSPFTPPQPTATDTYCVPSIGHPTAVTAGNASG
jgi:hypothetical protein